jgi:hypothetical protein
VSVSRPATRRVLGRIDRWRLSGFPVRRADAPRLGDWELGWGLCVNAWDMLVMVEGMERWMCRGGWEVKGKEEGGMGEVRWEAWLGRMVMCRKGCCEVGWIGKESVCESKMTDSGGWRGLFVSCAPE